MNAWEIYSYQHPGWPEPHPAVIVSHPDRVILKPEVTILLCSKPAGDAPGQSIAGIIPMIEQPRKWIAPCIRARGRSGRILTSLCLSDSTIQRLFISAFSASSLFP